jgi:transposase
MSERSRYWQRLTAEWKASGLRQAEFCRRHGIKGGTFGWWKHQLARAVGESPKRSAKGLGRFVEVRPVAAIPAAAYEIVVGGGRVIRVPMHFDPQSLSRLLAVVESC